MEQVIITILVSAGLVWLIGFGAFGFISLKEDESRAAKISTTIALAGAALLFLATFFPLYLQGILLAIITITILIGAVFFLLPIGHTAIGNDIPGKRFDERDIVFARARLSTGSKEYNTYYEMHPEKKVIDDRTRAKAGLLSPAALLANPILFASPIGSFYLTESLREAVNGPVAESRQLLPPEEMTGYLKQLAIYYGALDAGITELKPHHVYSHVGRGTGSWGDPIPIEHKFAIAFTVEMDHKLIGTSPDAPVIMESAHQYVESARIAVQLAAAIRALGYPARAHIDGNYRVVAPLVARDAGLGEIGRMGLLMTPTHGPRVRLGVVTADVDLIPDNRIPDPSVIDFCTICSKCADNCPSRSIPFDDRREQDGVLRWQINAETCFHYWNVIGTDCGRCMAVCPYSHPATFSHNLIRWGNNRSGAFRRLTNWMDDLFYGSHPSKRKPPLWTKIPDP